VSDPADRFSVARLGIGAGSKLAGELAGGALHFLLNYVAQLRLGPSLYGQFTYGSALGSIAGPVTDWGLQLTTAREIARDPATGSRTAGAALALKLLLAVVILLPLWVLGGGRPLSARIPVFAVALALVAASFVEFFGYVCRGLQRVELEALVAFAAKALTSLVGLIVLANGFGLLGLSLAYLMASLVGASGAAAAARRFLRPQLNVDAKAWRQMGLEALPLGAAMVLSMIHVRLPVLLLDRWRDVADVGRFGVAQKLTEPLAILPSAVMAAVFPAVSRRPAGDASVMTLGLASVAGLAAAGTAIGLAGFIAGPWLVDVLYGGLYAGAGAPLRVLALRVPVAYVNYALTHLLVARRRSAWLFRFNAVVLSCHFALGAWLVPPLGPAGAAMAATLGEVVLLMLCVWALTRPAPPGGGSARR
jgi:O-antigen/teichoic acid export membrane protein